MTPPTGSTRTAPTALCPRCLEPLRFAHAALLQVVRIDRPELVVRAELTHRACATLLQLAPGERREVAWLSALAEDSAARERLRQRARAQGDQVTRVLVTAANLALRSRRRPTKGRGDL